MLSPAVTREELQRVHRALCIATPLDELSDLMLTTLTVVAHNWRRNGVPRSAREQLQQPSRPFHRQAESKTQNHIDLKRRAAGDLD